MAVLDHAIAGLQSAKAELAVLDWFGRVLANPHDPTSPLVQCVMTGCKRASGTAGGIRRDMNRRHLGRIPAAALASLEVGGLYSDGNLVGRANVPESITVRIDPSQARQKLLSEVGISAHASPLRAPLGSSSIWDVDSPVKVIQVELVGTDSARSPDRRASPQSPSPLVLIIHELELVRFYYVISEKLGQALFNGWFDPEHFQQLVLTKYEGPHIRVPQMEARLEHRGHFFGADVPVLARILFEPTALDGARSVWRSIQPECRDHTGSSGSVRTRFPFRGQAQLHLTGRRIPMQDGTFAFLVHRILSCTGAFPFQRLSYQSEMQPGDGEHAGGLTERERWSKGGAMTLSVGSLVHDQPPRTGAETCPAHEEARRYLALRDIEIRVEKIRPSSVALVIGSPADEDQNLNFDVSVGLPTSGGRIRQQQIRDRLEPLTAPVTLSLFIQALKAIRVAEPGWTVATLGVGESWHDEASEVSYSHFPLVPCPRALHLTRQFSFVDAQRQHRRRLICAQIQTSQAVCYLVEAERRTGPGGRSLEELPVLLVWSEGRVQLSRAELLQILTQTVRTATTWPTEFDIAETVRRATVPHRRDVDEFAAALIRSVRTLPA